MSLELTIRQNSEGLRSEKATERKKCAETLKTFLTGDPAPALLTENILKKSGYNWNDLFDDVNEYLLKESKKFGTSTFDNAKALCTSLLFCVVAGANKGKAFIKCDKVTGACLLILRSNSLKRAFGDTYMNLLYKYILPCDYYVSHITPQSWEELLDECISTYNSIHCKLDEFTNLRLIFLVMQNSVNHCQFVTQLRDNVLKFMKTNLYSTQDKKIQETVLDIAVLLLEKLSTECHQTICEFTEFLIPEMVRYYDTKSDKKKKMLFRCFEISIRVHHPKGKLKGEKGAFAHNWDTWTICMESILEIVCTEVNYLQRIAAESKFKSQNDNILKNTCDYFIQVAALIYYQIFNNALSHREQSVERSTPKRPRLQYNKCSSFGDIIEELRHNCMPWLSIISVYIMKYGSTISVVDNLALLNILESMLMTNASNLNLEDFQATTNAMFENLALCSNSNDHLYPEVESIWKSCVRCSVSVNEVHSSVHSVLSTMLNLELINNKQHLNVLLKLYKEKAMPITKYSISTLNTLLKKNCGKFNDEDDRLIYLSWITQNENTSLDADLITELLLRLLSKDNLILPSKVDFVEEKDIMYNTIFESIDECILFSDFQLDINKEIMNNLGIKLQHFELHTELRKAIKDYLENQLILHIDALKMENHNLLYHLKFIEVILLWTQLLLKYKIINIQHVEQSRLWTLVKKALNLFYKSLVKLLKQNKLMVSKIQLLNSLQSILNNDYPDFICKGVSLYINENFIKIIYELLNETKKDEERDVIDVDQQDNEQYEIKSACINLLAIYCCKNELYRADILGFILDGKTYNFSYTWDVHVAFNCIELLAKSKENLPLESVFGLMQFMCKSLFRNSVATDRMLNILYNLIDNIGSHPSSNLRENCVRMLNGYLRICESLHYPPHTSASLYKCLAKVEALKAHKGQNWNSDFRDALIEGTKSNVHTIRLYCSYLLMDIVDDYNETNMVSFTNHLENIFLVPENEQTVMKDELRNRSASVFHCLSAIALGKKNLTNIIIARILEIHVTKSRNERLAKRVLSKLVAATTGKDTHEFLNKSIIFALNYWFSKSYQATDFPFRLYGFETYEQFVQKHMRHLVPVEALWHKEGNLEACKVYCFCKTNLGMSGHSIIEVCFSNFLVLCLPNVVCQKYGLDYKKNSNAFKVLQTLSKLLGTDKWSNMFMESITETVSLAPTFLYDIDNIQKTLEATMSPSSLDFYYPKSVFEAVLKYIGEKIDQNIMQYLCESSCEIVSKIILEMWSNVLYEEIYEIKILSLHRFLSMLECIPNNCSTSKFIFFYACNNLTNAIRKSDNAKLIKTFSNALLAVFKKLLPENLEMIQETIPELMSILVFKAEDGYGQACANLSNYVIEDLKYCLKESLDLVDGINALSQGMGPTQSTLSGNQQSFTQNLRTFLSKSKCWSYETLCNLKEFLRTNRTDLLKLFNDLNSIKGFSEECDTSLVHQTINHLINIVRESNDEKSKIEAENCLAEIDTYDLKTLVMRVPRDTKIISDANPISYFILNAVQSLADIVVDEDPEIAAKGVEALTSILQYRDGKLAFDSAKINHNILQSFLSSKRGNNKLKFKIEENKLSCCLNSIELWSPTDIDNSNHIYVNWLTELTIALLDSFTTEDNFLSSFTPVCRHKPTLCEKLLPSLISLTIFHATEAHIRLLSERINRYFVYFYEDICNADSQYSNEVVGRPKIVVHQHKLIIQTMLEIADFVRLQKSHYKKWSSDLIESYNYLKLDYKCVAWAAAVSDRSMAAIYYGELWCAAQNQGVPPPSPEFTADLKDGEHIQSIFRKCFVSIGEMDAIDGCGTGHLTNVEERRRHLLRSDQYADALLTHDIALSFENNTGNQLHELHHGVAISLNKCGMKHLAVEYVKTLPDSEELDDIKYQCFTELGDWSIFVDTLDLEAKSKNANANLDSILKAFQYACLKDSLTIQTTKEFETRLELPLQRAKLAVSRLVNKLNMDNCQSVYNVVSKLHLFSEIEDYFSVQCNNALMSELISKWQVENLSPYQDFKHIEAIILQRSLMLEHASKSHDDLLKSIIDLQLKFAELANSNGRWQVSDRLVAVAKQLLICGEVSLVEGQIHWAKGHKDIALSLIRRIISESSVSAKLHAAALRQYGSWMAESKYESAREIIDKYLRRSLDVLGPNGHTETRLKVYVDIAVFADSEYKQVVSYMKSSVFENKKRCLKNMKGTAITLRNSQLTITKDEQKAMYTHERLSNLDQAEIDSTYEEKKRFLDLAMKYYLLSLSQGEENDLAVFRVISLWFENQNIELNDTEHGTFNELLSAVPIRKYLPVLPQLSPRLTTKDDAFNINLRNIITKCAVDHPHHTLPILFGLKNSHKDKVIMNASAGASAAAAARGRTADEPRVLAARRLVQELGESVDDLSVIIKQMDLMCDAIISFANYVSKDKEPKQNIPKAESIGSLKNLDKLPVPTITLPINKMCIYTNIVSVVSFSNTFELVGGINCPKKITCRGSDGKLRTVLVKGKDDLRQDAVMQQVFTIVNTLLEKDPVTSKNKLLIRTYKVVPLSRQSGVLEWCEGTIPIGGYLVGSPRQPGAHQRYRPMDMSCSAARMKMSTCHEKGRTNAEKLAIFQTILKDFKAVFQYFFTEHYLEPVTWYERRLAYTKSVATSSMVGYIMGLGDRHVHNILIDKKTSEVIHIDFGIAFDQGKALPTPESVPFRLTQDIIAGFGPSGVEGVFRRCCEKTLQLLRDNQETLLTILEVLLCDPLYSWTITPAQAKRKQYSEAIAKDSSVQSTIELAADGSGTGLAQRALLAVGSKLSGAEGGAVHGMAVRGQVARLLHQAADPVNLSRLFHGWQPYL